MSCCGWTAFPDTNNVWGQVTGKCADGKSTPSVHSPCFAGVQDEATKSDTHVTDKDYVEFGVCESMIECEAAASNGLAGAPPCLSVTWHSPTCKNCGADWVKHCYCAVTDIWLPDVASTKPHAAQVGVESAKCSSPGGVCGAGWEFTGVAFLSIFLYLLGVGRQFPAFSITSLCASGFVLQLSFLVHVC